MQIRQLKNQMVLIKNTKSALSKNGAHFPLIETYYYDPLHEERPGHVRKIIH